MKASSVFPLLVFVVLSISESACKKDQAELKTDPYDLLCTPTSDYYFRGTINDIDKCWNVGENYYQKYSGGGSESDENGQHYFWMQGLDQYPVPYPSEAILIRSESSVSINNCTQQQFFDSFVPGTVPIIPINSAGNSGIEIIYVLNGTSYTSRNGPQDGNEAELVEANKKTDAGNYDQIVLKYRFTCNLYSCTGNYFGKISAGELRTLQIN